MFKGKRILICQPIVYGINGSTMVTLELAEEIGKTAKEVIVYSDMIDSPAREYFEKKNIPLVSFDDEPNYRLEDFDLVWVHSQVLPKSLIRDMGRFSKAKKTPFFVFLHMSALDFFPDEKPWIYELEERIADKVLVISEEVREKTVEKYLEGIKTEYYRNPAPDKYIAKNKKDEIKKVLIVSNHCPAEVIDARKVLEERNVSTTVLGETGKYCPITPELLEKYDAVITIGKTVQYCLLAGIPVYVYDHFGGPGYLTEESYEGCRARNFSGRDSCCKKTGSTIADEMLNGYKAATRFVQKNKNYFINDFSLTERLKAILNNMTAAKKQDFSESYIAYVEISQDLARHSMYYSGHELYVTRRKDKRVIEKLSNENRAQKAFIAEVSGSIACRGVLWLKRRIRRVLRNNKRSI